MNAGRLIVGGWEMRDTPFCLRPRLSSKMKTET
jgi:hypothetical protein